MLSLIQVPIQLINFIVKVISEALAILVHAFHLVDLLVALDLLIGQSLMGFLQI